MLIQAVNETIADLRRCPDGRRWAEQITTLVEMRDHLVAGLGASEHAA